MKRFIACIAFILISLSPVIAIGFGIHTFEIRTSPEFSQGVFPTSLLYQFDFPVPDLIPGRVTEFDFRLDNGLSFRTLRQHPDTGVPFASDPGSVNFPTDYITIYDEMNLVFGQGFLESPLSEKDLFKLWLTFDIHIENSYERLSWLIDPTETEGLFYIQPKIGDTPAVERFPDSSWIGQPELSGNKSTIAPSFSLGFDIELMEDKVTRRNGLKYSFWTRLNPAWTAWFGNSSQDYLLFWNKLDLAYTLFSIPQQGSDLTYLSLVLDNTTTYRFIAGSKVPYYIQGGEIFGTRVVNTENVLTDRLSLTLYGPQIVNRECYPFMTAFLDCGIGIGRMLNSASADIYNDIVASYGMKLGLVILNIANFYLEIGRVAKAALNEPAATVTRVGFSFGV